VSDKGSACKTCRDHIYIGTSLVRTSRIAVATTDAKIHGPKLMEPIFGEYQVSLDVDGKLGELADKGVLLKYWDISLPQNGRVAKDITAKFVNGYVPKYKEEDNEDDRLLTGPKREETKLELIEAVRPGKEIPKTFLHIAKKALNRTDKPGRFAGIEALGVLKADVDNLGLIFACGLKRNSLSRLATLSSQMNYFFSIYLPCALSTKDEFMNIYTVFAGGDDLFLVGPWNRIINFVLFLRREFQRYVCCNAQVTISAGISLNKPGVPVPVIAQKAEDALKASKDKGRDSVTLFGETVKWAEFEDLNGIRETMLDWLNKGFINNAMLFRLNAFAAMAKQKEEILGGNDVIEMDDWEVLMWESKFRYNLVRNIAKTLKGEERERAVREVEQAAKWLQDYGGALKTVIWWIIYDRR
jgi:CRISPR-associated protein Csm1